MDDAENYYYSLEAPGYVYHVLANMVGCSYEELRENYNKYSSFSLSIDNILDLNVQELTSKIADMMGASINGILAGFKTRNEVVSIEDRGISLRTLDEIYDLGEEINFFFFFSCQQGDIWREGQIRYYMQSREGKRHKCPHVHVNVSHKYSGTFAIETGEPLADDDIPEKYHKIIKEKICEHREYLLKCWNEQTDGVKVDINYGMGIVGLTF